MASIGSSNPVVQEVLNPQNNERSIALQELQTPTIIPAPPVLKTVREAAPTTNNQRTFASPGSSDTSTFAHGSGSKSDVELATLDLIHGWRLWVNMAW